MVKTDGTDHIDLAVVSAILRLLLSAVVVSIFYFVAPTYTLNVLYLYALVNHKKKTKKYYKHPVLSDFYCRMRL